MTALIVPAIILAVTAYAAAGKIDVFSAMTEGAKKGFRVIYNILPTLIIMLSAIYMLRASGALDALTRLCAPLLRLAGIPEETAPLIFLRPFSGSGALAAGSEIMSTYGPDSYIGRCAAVMLGSTETTFYVLAVYFAASRTKNIRRIVPAALVADIVGFFTAALSVSLLF